MIYLRLTRLNGELLVDEGMSPNLSLEAQEAGDMADEPAVYCVTQLMRRLRPGWTLVVECEGKDPGEDLDD